ncbi:MAG: branched-chain amino acid transport system II carrier protein [Synergistaceae bacterium]|jgi:LIVCS family branched-chain amino acid:cation transporter|nr:branched-chain amino acid transport system II carrier protein [Synergistaceae bacterium]
MKKDGNVLSTVVIGFALFASFFGAGNLIFPPSIGLASGKDWLLALSGFAISGVLLPVLSFMAVARAGGTEEGIASEMGRVFSILFASVVMLCTSLLIAVPRTAATTHELGIVTLFGPMSQMWTSCVFFGIVLYLSYNPSTVVEMIGKYLTPVLILIMVVIIVKGFVSPIGIPARTALSGAFRRGFIDGYQTLDVFGGLVFSGAVFAALVAHRPDDRRAQMKMACGCTLVAGVSLLFIYGGLLYLGATGTDFFSEDMGRPALLLALIGRLFDRFGPQSLAFATIFACLTTAIGLTAGAAYFFDRVSKGGLPYRANVVVICVVSLLISMLGVDMIVSCAAPVLIFIYPAAIVLVLLNVFRSSFFNRGTFLGAVYSTLLVGFLEMLPVLGIHDETMLTAFSVLPFASHGFAWTVPAVVCGVLGTIFQRKSETRKPGVR